MQQVDISQQRKKVAELEGREVELSSRLAHLEAMAQEATKELQAVRFERETIEDRIAQREARRL